MCDSLPQAMPWRAAEKESNAAMIATSGSGCARCIHTWIAGAQSGAAAASTNAAMDSTRFEEMSPRGS